MSESSPIDYIHGCRVCGKEAFSGDRVKLCQKCGNDYFNSPELKEAGNLPDYDPVRMSFAVRTLIEQGTCPACREPLGSYSYLTSDCWTDFIKSGQYNQIQSDVQVRYRQIALWLLAREQKEQNPKVSDPFAVDANATKARKLQADRATRDDPTPSGKQVPPQSNTPAKVTCALCKNPVHVNCRHGLCEDHHNKDLHCDDYIRRERRAACYWNTSVDSTLVRHCESDCYNCKEYKRREIKMSECQTCGTPFESREEQKYCEHCGKKRETTPAIGIATTEATKREMRVLELSDTINAKDARIRELERLEATTANKANVWQKDAYASHDRVRELEARINDFLQAQDVNLASMHELQSQLAEAKLAGKKRRVPKYCWSCANAQEYPWPCEHLNTPQCPHASKKHAPKPAKITFLCQSCSQKDCNRRTKTTVACSTYHKRAWLRRKEKTPNAKIEKSCHGCKDELMDGKDYPCKICSRNDSCLSNEGDNWQPTKKPKIPRQCRTCKSPLGSVSQAQCAALNAKYCVNVVKTRKKQPSLPRRCRKAGCDEQTICGTFPHNCNKLHKPPKQPSLRASLRKNKRLTRKVARKQKLAETEKANWNLEHELAEK